MGRIKGFFFKKRKKSRNKRNRENTEKASWLRYKIEKKLGTRKTKKKVEYKIKREKKRDV